MLSTQPPRSHMGGVFRSLTADINGALEDEAHQSGRPSPALRRRDLRGLRA